MKHQKFIILFLSILHASFFTIKPSNYKDCLENLKRDASNYWFYPSAEQAKKNNLIKILEFYESMPRQTKSINDWIKYHPQLFNNTYSFDAYQTKAKEDLRFIHAIINDDKNDNQDIMPHLYQLRQSIQDSLSATKAQYEEDLKKIREDRIYNLQAKKIQEEIDNNRSIRKAHESQAVEQRNLRIAQERETEQLIQLANYLRTLNFYRLQAESKKTLQDIESVIKNYTSKHLGASQEKKEIFIQLAQVITLIKEAEKCKSLEEENKQLKESIARDQIEINEAQIIINQILDQTEQLGLSTPTISESDRKRLEDEHKKLKKRSDELGQAKKDNIDLIDTILHATQSTEQKDQRKKIITQAQTVTQSDSNLPVAFAVSANDPGYHGIVVEATPIVENREPQRLAKR